jgi:hypothetical protein
VKIDRPPVPVTTLESTSKKVLVWPYVADKIKEKNIVIGDLRMPNMSCRVVTRTAPEDRRRRGQARSDTRSRSHVLRTSGGPGTKAE